MEDLSKIFEEAMDKAKELSGKGKLIALIKAEEIKKDEQYFRLGKKYYELYKDAPEQALTGYVDKLKASDAKIAQYQEEMNSTDEGDSYRDVEEQVQQD